MTTLNCLAAGECAELLKIETEKDVKERLRMLNICCGARVKMIKRAFFGSTFLVEADGVRAGMRKNLAEKILVKKISETKFEEPLSPIHTNGRKKL